jgi:hypothetical protein
MITLKEIPNKTFETKESALAYLVENKASIIATKKAMTKQADSIYYQAEQGTNKAVKSNSDVLTASLVINTTNVMDSHSDVHMKGIWNQSVKQQKNILFLREHKMTFENIISDNVKASVSLMDWKQLGFDLQGNTEALIFDVAIDKERNSFMFEQYSKGYVKEHSVGMRYVKYLLCLDSIDRYDVEEKENWDKYISEVANKDEAIAQGYFWAILEAKIIEGSAVVKGSNSATPVLSVETKDIEPLENTQKQEPSDDTQKHRIFVKF